MNLSFRRKLTIIPLLVYWSLIFASTHIPVPKVVFKAGVWDKNLHFLAYFVLVFLLWFAISPDKKVNWRKAAAWWVLFVVVWYGVIDEVLQGYVRRTPDFWDFFADFGGAIAGLILFSFVSFWPAFLAVTGIAIFFSTNLTQVNPAELLPITDDVFCLLAYGVFTAVWIRCMHNFLPATRPPRPKWLITATALPTGLLACVKSFSAILGRGYRLEDAPISLAAIAVVVIIAALYSSGGRAIRRPDGNV